MNGQMRSEAELRDLIEEHLKRVDSYLDVDVETLEPTQRANVARAVFNKGHAIATYAALLGVRETATLLLAADYELEVSVESRFIPSCLFDDGVVDV